MRKSLYVIVIITIFLFTACGMDDKKLTATPNAVVMNTEELQFSEKGHFLQGDSIIRIEKNSEKRGYITYTLDGTEPQKDSLRYKGSIRLESGTEDFPNCYTIRAKVWYSDGTESDTYVHTYFVSENVMERFTTYVLSINGDPKELTDGPNAIMHEENRIYRGREYERKVHLELISESGETVFAQHAGIRLFGNKSRATLPIKPFKIYARKEYEAGKGTFAFDGFGSVTLDGSKTIQKYDKLILRNGGDDFQGAHIRDEMVHQLAAEAGFATYEASVPAVIYLNGAYYGLFWIRESYCDKYFQYRNGKSDGEYIVIEGSDTEKNDYGDDKKTGAVEAYNAIYNKYAGADLTDDTVYTELCSFIDIENYLDYASFNLYVGNADWPNTNVKCFRYYASDGVYAAGEQDGRWRFLLHDIDSAFGRYSLPGEKEDAKSEDYIRVISQKSDLRYSPLLDALLKREDCRQYFIERTLYYLEEAVSYEKVSDVLEQLQAERDEELDYYLKHLELLKDKDKSLAKTIGVTADSVKRQIDTILRFAEYRPQFVKQQLNQLFDCGLE